ncbi:glycosyl hydrolase family 28 protein [Nonomuraea guangzhouensis]|uniref:Glycosyl hydrolase family 28 protein n=1 Tax=Nonomuraea guangzhouensis TaxID=1291555 RepID=A0ABW4G623_9ACTN|nr:glycosyl hydrolase family 28 protein [Nonomuraea guangzhouensis]
MSESALARAASWVAAVVLAIFSIVVPAQSAGALAVFNVKDYGATGNGSTNDTAAINAAITAANSAGGGTVQFPSGTYKSANSIHMKSNVTIQLDSGSTIMGASNDDYDAPESNPNDDYQDYGHSHFHNAMIWGDRLTNIGFVGTGTIDGGGNLITGNPGSGEADKIISLTRCDGLTVSGIRLRRGGHFAMLTNACNNITSDNLRIDTASDRDGWNVISAQNVTIRNANIAANDDALAFKSDWALGQTYANGNVTVTDANLSAECCNALMFGSETCGNFTGYHFERISINGSNKSGLGMVSMDGTVISDVHYKDITMTNVRAAITEKIGTRRRCGNSPGVGRIENITYENVTSSGQSGNNFTATLWGESNTSNRIRNVTFTNVDLTVPGGNGCMGTGVPSNDASNYNPNSIGTRPAYGWYIHNAHDIKFVDSSVQFNSNDCRPAVIANTGSTVTFDRFTAERGSNSPNDMVFQTITGYCVQNSQNTAGGALRVSATGSTDTCTPGNPGTDFLEAEDATISQGVVESNHAGFSGTGFVNGDNVVGSYVQWSAPAEQAGNATLTFRYANGTTTNRPMDITVNGVLVADELAFPPTGAWTTWQSVTVTAPLNAGANTVRATSTTAGGGPNLDYLDTAAAGPAPTEYQAENATISQGVVESNHAGFTGTGFVNYDNVVGSYVEFAVTAAQAGNATVVLRFANGTTANRPMDITVNGVLVSDELAFPATGAWTTWSTATVTVPLNAGANVIRTTSTTAGGGPNLDRISVA